MTYFALLRSKIKFYGPHLPQSKVYRGGKRGVCVQVDLVGVNMLNMTGVVYNQVVLALAWRRVIQLHKQCIVRLAPLIFHIAQIANYIFGDRVL